MILKKYYYSLLRYRPSYILEEQINLGLLFFFEEEHQSLFFYPNHLQRVKDVFPKTDISILQKYLKAYKQEAEQIKYDLFTLQSIEILLETHFGKTNATSLIFEMPKMGLYQDKEFLIKQECNLFFNSYIPVNESDSKHDDAFLLDLFKYNLQKYPTVQNLVKPKYAVETSKNRIEFDFSWQNGKLNLVQPLSFDMKQEHSIQNKALRWFGSLVQIQGKAKELNLHFDFLIAKPKNDLFLDKYQAALDTLRDAGGEDILSFIDEEKISSYVDNLAQTVHS